jgi:hypothetical protein
MAEIDIDTSDVNASQQSTEKLGSAKVRKSTIIIMIVIIASFALLALFANIQRLRRDQIETVVVTPAVSITPQPR